MPKEKIPLIVHVIHRLNVGGLENGLVNLINTLSKDNYRHTIICLTESSDFAKRIKRDDVKVYELHKREGKDLGLYFRLWKLLRTIRPDIVHSRNLSALEASVLGAFAGVPIRVHGEHGRDIYDLDGKNKKYKLLRRLCSPFINCFITMSKDLETWLLDEVGIPAKKVVQLYNGVDTDRFFPADDEKNSRSHLPTGFASSDSIIIGNVGRLEPVKDQLTLVKAFIYLVERYPSWRESLRLVLVGDGALKCEIEALLVDSKTSELVWLAGSRDDVPGILREMDIFVLPSLGEGISNTILEAMATALPVVASNVGGNPELVQDGLTGRLVPAHDPIQMARALQQYIEQPVECAKQGRAGHQRVDEVFSLTAMIQRYQSVYDGLLAAKELA